MVNIGSPLSQILQTLWIMTICSDTLHWSYWSDITWTRNLLAELDLIADIDLITKIRDVSVEYLQRMRLQPTEDANSSKHLVLSHLGLAFVPMLRPVSPELLIFPDIEVRTSVGLFWFELCTNRFIPVSHTLSYIYCFISQLSWDTAWYRRLRTSVSLWRPYVSIKCLHIKC